MTSFSILVTHSSRNAAARLVVVCASVLCALHGCVTEMGGTVAARVAITLLTKSVVHLWVLHNFEVDVFKIHPRGGEIIVNIQTAAVPS